MKKVTTILILFLTLIVKSQSFYNNKQLNALMFVKSDERSLKFEAYVMTKHGSGFNFNNYKTENKLKYLSELWYYSQSFYIKRDYAKGEKLDDSIIDISRFDHSRKNDEEVIISLDGFRDVIVLLPTKKLLFTND